MGGELNTRLVASEGTAIHSFWSSKGSFKADLKSLAGIYWLEKAAQATSLVRYP
jgi:hypothetical protein